MATKNRWMSDILGKVTQKVKEYTDSDFHAFIVVNGERIPFSIDNISFSKMDTNDPEMELHIGSKEGKEECSMGNVSAMRRALEELAHYDDNDANMDDPYCRDGHNCAEIARAALATIKENKSDCPAPTGNASAMRTALRKLRYLASVEFANKADGIETTDLLPQAILYHSQKALSEPLRNCDKFGFLDLARLAFQEVEEMPEGNDDTQMRGWLNRFVEWLFAPATEQIGDGDGE